MSENKKRPFSVVIGNPPFQENRETTKDMPIYPYFIDSAKQIADIAELITPARFLFNAGATPKEWNRKMLNDGHFRVLRYYSDSQSVFANTDIKGGVAIHLYDTSQEGEPIKTFTAHDILNSISARMSNIPNLISLNTIMFPYSTYALSDKLWQDFPEKKADVEYIAAHRNELKKEEKDGKMSNLRIITTNIFDLLPELFYDKLPNDGNEYVKLLGRQNGERCEKYILAQYIDVGGNYDKWKVILPAVNGCGAIGEVLSTPVIGTPVIGYTQTYLGIGAFDTESEARALYKYICTKFVRTCLGILKITQHNPPEKWKYVPLQDFTSSSDIDWSKLIPEIDKQLYDKYGLTPEEREFIETKVRAME